MKISDLSAKNSVSELSEKRTHAPAPSPAPPAADQVSVGKVAAAASKALEPADQRVAELRQKYLEGTYKVDAAALSAKIVDDHLES